MVRMGFLVDASATELTQWIMAQIQQRATYELENETFVLASVQETVLPLMQELAIQTTGKLTAKDGLALPSVVTAQFCVTAIGFGQTVEVTVISEAEPLKPYLLEICQDAGDKWPLARATLWTDKVAWPEVSLVELQLLTDFGNFEIELERFVQAYANESVRYVTFEVRRDLFLHRGSFIDRKMHLIDHNRTRSWDIHVHLKGIQGRWTTKTDLPLDVEISRAGGRFPVLLTITSLNPYAYFELVKFAEDFVSHCQRTWEWASVTLDRKPPGNEPAQAKAEKLESENDRLTSPPLSQVTLELSPWEKIPDYAWDREALKLWWEGYTHKEIALKLHLAEKTVLNRMSSLRKTYGDEIVVTERKRRGRPAPFIPGG